MALLEARVPDAPGVSIAVETTDGSAHGWRFSPRVTAAMREAIESGALGDAIGADSADVFDAVTARLRLVGHTVERADAAELYRYGTSSPVNFATRGGATVLTDVDIFKAGTFNGLTVSALELSALVERFYELRDGNVFLPPVRLDHSWSILAVIGYIEELRVVAAPDMSAGGAEAAFLRADLRITEPDAVELIRRGTAINRSSEIGPYITNGGIEYPLVVWGVAFVDIPAVEGLRPVKLAKAYAFGHPKITDLSGATMHCTHCGANDHASEACPTLAAGGTGTTGTTGTPPAGTTGADTTGGGTGTGAGTGTGTQPPAAGTGGEGAGTGTAPAGDAPPAGASTGLSAEAEARLVALAQERVVAQLAAAGLDPTVITALQTDMTRVHAENAEREITALTARGVVTPGNRAAVLALLSHPDAAVRDGARTVLEIARPPVTLGAANGQQADTPAGSAGNGTTANGQPATGAPGQPAITLSMTGDEVGRAWSALTTEQRADEANRKALAAWHDAHPGG